MMTNFDQQLEVWLHRIGVTPYKPVGTVSPLVSKALANYCWPDAQFIIDAHIEESDGMQSLFKHCGVPNVFLAQLNSIKLVESLELFGERLCAHPQQAPIIHKTDFLPWVDFSLDSSSPIPSPIEIAESDRDEFTLIKKKVVSDRTDTFSLRHDNAFMLGHYLVEFLLWPSENSTCELAVGLQPFMNVPVTKIIKQISKSRTYHFPIDYEMLNEAALTGECVQLEEVLSDVLTYPFDLTPSRLALLIEDYQTRISQNQIVLGA